MEHRCEFLAMVGSWGVTVGCSTSLKGGRVQPVLRATCGTHALSCLPRLQTTSGTLVSDYFFWP